jgi:thiol:disulfide interchange protein DsbA
MRKFIGFLAIAASVLFSFAVSAAEDNFEDGAYTKVKGTYTPNTLVEYFSFFCGHCVRFQPTMRDLERDFPEVKFSRVHVAFLGGDLGNKMQSLYAFAEQKGVEDKFTELMFEQVKKAQAAGDKGQIDPLEVFGALGITKDDLDAGMNNILTNSRVVQYDNMVKDQEIEGTPTMVVDGIYRINTDHVKSYEYLKELIKYLQAKKGA